jgi:hypothetical protein
MFAIGDSSRTLGEGWRGKENDRGQIILKYISSVFEDGITKHIESC